MKILLHTPLDNEIVQILLSEGELDIKALFASLIHGGHNISIQGLYKRLRILVGEGIVIKNKQSIIVSNEWKQSLLKLLNINESFPELKSGESLVYSFKSLDSLDIYWKHIMALFEQNLSDFPVFLYNPYEIWVNLEDREESEVEYFKQFDKKERFCFLLLGKQVAINEDFKQKYTTPFVQISVGTEIGSDRDYVAVIADYIFTTKLSPTITQSLASMISSSDSEWIKKMNSLVSKTTSIKIKVEKNSSKAKKLRKQIAKDFYIPKELKDKYPLF